jgi:NADH-quinone oxidoreductase subunit J
MVLSGWEAVFFWVFALAALVAGLLTIMARNAVHSALFLISALISVAALFILLGAEFIAGVQILVYVGGVMVLFLFVIMLVNVSAEERGSEELFNKPRQVGASIVVAGVLGISLVSVISRSVVNFQPPGSEPGLTLKERAAEQDESQRRQQSELRDAATGTSKISRDTQVVGASLYRYGSLPFEIASVLLLVAIVGSVLLARTAKQEAAADDDTETEAEGANGATEADFGEGPKQSSV